jgi:hypothetical protein
VAETVNPLTLGGGVFNAGLSHLTNSDPRYGTDSAAFAQRFGASAADITTQNFFGDCLLASAFTKIHVMCATVRRMGNFRDSSTRSAGPS